MTSNESVIADIVEELKFWGHGHDGDTPLVFMSDGEPAIRALKERLMQLLPGRNSEEVAAKHQSAWESISLVADGEDLTDKLVTTLPSKKLKNIHIHYPKRCINAIMEHLNIQ